MKNLTKILPIIFLVIFATCLSAVIVIGAKFAGERLPSYNKEPKFDQQAFDKGRYVGRNAMIIYIGRETKDTFRIEITELLRLEDSLSAIQNNENK